VKFLNARMQFSESFALKNYFNGSYVFLISQISKKELTTNLKNELTA